MRSDRAEQEDAVSLRFMRSDRAEQEGTVSLRFMRSDWERSKRVQSHWGSCEVIERGAGGCSLTEVHAKWLRAEQEGAVSLRFMRSDWKQCSDERIYFTDMNEIEAKLQLSSWLTRNGKSTPAEWRTAMCWICKSQRQPRNMQGHCRRIFWKTPTCKTEEIKSCNMNPGCEYARWILRCSGGFVTTYQTTRRHIPDDSNRHCCQSPKRVKYSFEWLCSNFGNDISIG
jgi:hypothetical protein